MNGTFFSMNNFSEWLNSEMESRNLKPADLARMANVSQSTISMIISGQRGPGPELCLAVADAFNLPAEDVFRKAGFLPPVSELDGETREAAHLFSQLGAYDRRQLIAEMRRILAQDNYRTIRETQALYTTAEDYPEETLELINDFLKRLEKEGWKKIK